MDKRLQVLMDDLAAAVDVYEGERPLQVIDDAIAIAQRNGLLYRYAQNGSHWQLRWTPSDPVRTYPEGQVCEVIVQHIIDNSGVVVVEGIFMDTDVEEEDEELPFDDTIEDDIQDLVDTGKMTQAAGDKYLELYFDGEPLPNPDEIEGSGVDGRILLSDITDLL